MRHDRHYTLEQARRPWTGWRSGSSGCATRASALNDEEVREALAEAGPTNGGGDPGRAVSEAFLDLRGAATELDAMDIVLRDLDRGLVDFPAIRDGRGGLPLLGGVGGGRDHPLARARLGLRRA